MNTQSPGEMQHGEKQLGKKPPRQENRDALIPLALIGIIVAVVALIVALGSHQSPGATDNSMASMNTDSSTTSASGVSNGTDTIIPPKLEAAGTDNYDSVAKRYDPETQPVAAGPKTFNLTTEEAQVKVGDSVVTLWTFNHTAPGPVLRAVVGDKITINLTNNMKSKMFHSVDFHASRMSMGGGDVQVAPGKTGSFTFTAEYPGIFMYHCGTPPVLEHIGRGMYGMLIVQPKAGFGKPMREVAVVQSELYRNFVDMQAGNEAAVVMNGVPKQYIDAPIKAKPDEQIRMFFLNAGPSKMSSFHVVGTVFDKVWADGNPFNLTVGRQAVGVPVSGGALMEFQLKGEGKFPFLTHSFHDVDSGAVGLFVTGDGSRTLDGAAATAAGKSKMAH